MSDMVRLAERFSCFLKSNNIDPESVNLIIRAKNDSTFARIESAMRRDLNSLNLLHSHPKDFPQGIRDMKLHGVSISLSSLDYDPR